MSLARRPERAGPLDGGTSRWEGRKWVEPGVLGVLKQGHGGQRVRISRLEGQVSGAQGSWSRLRVTRAAGLQMAWPGKNRRACVPVGESAVDLGATGMREVAGWGAFSG